MLKKLNIANKLALNMIGLSLIVIAMLSALFFYQFDRALKERVLLQLSSVKQLKIVKIKNELSDRMEFFYEYCDNREQRQTMLEYFEFVKGFTAVPDSIMHYSLPANLELQPENTRLVDLTLQDKDRRITIALVLQKGDSIYVGVSKIPGVQEILLERTGLGQTGESYIVGDDYKLRTISRFAPENAEDIEVKSEGVIRAFNSREGEDLFLDYRGIEVFSSYEKIEMNGLRWAILTEINHQEALFPLRQLRINLSYILIIILVFVVVVAYSLSRILVSPVLAMEKRLNAMSKGILDKAPDKERHDEIGQMFDALNKLVDALSETIVFAGKIGAGNFEAEYKPLSPNDKLGEALIQMKHKLQTFKENEERLLQENQRSILNGEEKERSRLSKELHDGLGPLLTTLRLNIQAMDVESKKKESLLELLDGTIGEVRRMSNNLMPSVLVDFGAGEAIGNLVEQIRNHTGLPIRYKNDMTAESTIDDSIHIVLYRVAQEAINNAIKHAGATEIKVSLSEFDDHVGFFISDNGKGFDPNEPVVGNGLRNMRERVKLVNGTFDMSTSAKGTTIEVEIPIK